MKEIILYELEFNPLFLYQTPAMEALEQRKSEAKFHPAVRWALERGINVQITRYGSYATAEAAIIYYAALTEEQQVEYALRF